jgi:signal transduction histidine kinase
VVKHSRATEVVITVCRTEETFSFRVQDNGIGFCPDSRSSGNGLKNMQRRSQEIGGQLVIESVPGGGTVVTLSAPIA